MKIIDVSRTQEIVMGITGQTVLAVLIESRFECPTRYVGRLQ